MSMYNLNKDSDAYSKTSRSLRQYYRDESALGANDNIDFPVIIIIVFHSNLNSK